MASLTKELYLRQYMGVMEEALEDGKTVKLDVVGESMSPTLVVGDAIIMESPENIVKGDIILYRVSDSEFILHRVVKMGVKITTIGDNNIAKESVERDDIIARVAIINKADGRSIERGSVRYRHDFAYAKRRRFLRRIKRLFVR